MTVLPAVESRILRLFDFGLACKRLFLLYLRCWLSGSNSVGRMPASQAGRRRFESGLPLHVFNNLQGFRIPSIPSIKPQIPDSVGTSVRGRRRLTLSR